MIFSRQQRVDDQTLRGYLFGDLPQDETERLDELSVVDDDFSARLDTVESDLVDAYVRGELSGDTLEKFQTSYMSSPQRRERVAFARSLSSFASAHVPQSAADRLAAGNRSSSSSLRSWLESFALPRFALAGGLAMLLAISGLLFDNLHLRDTVHQATADRASLQQRERDLEARLNDEHASNAQTASELDQVRKSLAQVENNSVGKRIASELPVSVAAFVLAPQLRGAGQMPSLSLPQGTTRVVLRLDLESNDFPNYSVTLRSIRTDKVLWHSGRLKAVMKGQNGALSASVPAKLLKQEVYQIDLTGMPPHGDAELVSSYVFRILIK
jgi:hypothetical protein